MHEREGAMNTMRKVEFDTWFWKGRRTGLFFSFFLYSTQYDQGLGMGTDKTGSENMGQSSQC